MNLFEENNQKGLKVKICGVAQEQDIQACFEMGVDAVGFLLGNAEGKFPTDKLTVEEAKKLVRYTPPQMTSVLLVKNSSFDEIDKLTGEILPNAVQLQSLEIGNEVIQLLKLKYPNVEWIKTIKIRDSDTLEVLWENISRYLETADAILLDSAKGGSGKTHDWMVSKEISLLLKKTPMPVILAGGLNVGNIREAVSVVDPNMIDLMSGVSLDKGIKNIPEIKRLMNVVNSINFKKNKL